MAPKKNSADDTLEVEWLDLYGEPIDCVELRKIASLAAVERERSAVSSLRTLDAYAKLLRRHRQEQIGFLEEQVHGEDVKLSERLDAEVAAAGERDKRRREARIADYAKLLEGAAERARCSAPQRNVRALPRHANPTELLLALRLAQRSAASRAEEMVSEMLHRTPDWRWKAKTQGADAALALAASGVAEWIRARHRDQSGRLDGRTSWRDVARCLLWYGHDLSHIATEKRDDALRNLVARIQKKRLAAEAAETGQTKKAAKG